MNFVLFAIASLIWGSTFFAIKFQLGIVPVAVSVVYRFAIATVFCFVIAYLKKSTLKLQPKDHFFVFLQGICLFSINYVLTYESEKYLTSGLVALGFTSVIYFNTFGVWLFFGQKIKVKNLVGATLGSIGLFLIFYNEIKTAISGDHVWHGLICLGFAGLSASAGNLLGARNHRRKIPFLSTVAYGMLYGTIFSAVIAASQNAAWIWNSNPNFLFSLLYLAIFGSVIAFIAYLSLANRIGAEHSAYVNIMSPVLALILSTIFESFHWQMMSVLGIVFCFAGNYLVLKPVKV